MHKQQLIGITRAADLLGVHINTLRSWADKGLIAVVVLPSGHRRFALDVIDRKRQEMGMPALTDRVPRDVPE